MAREFWLNYQPSIIIDRLKKSITVPAFSYACGPTHQSLKCEPGGLGANFDLGFTSKLTVECWVNLYVQGNLPIIFLYKDNIFSLRVYNGEILLYIELGGTSYGPYSFGLAPYGQWTHLAFTWNSNDLIKTYVNGELIETISAIGLGDIAAGASSFQLGGNDCFMYVNELRIWSSVRSQEQIVQAMSSSRDVTLETPNGLAFYWKFDETGTITTDKVASVVLNFTSLPNISFSTESYYPFRFGASFIIASSEITLGTRCSIKWPVVSSSPDHALVVMWQDTEGNTQRRKLYGDVEEDIAPDPEDYRGESIESPFTLEFWNIDGNEDINLSSTLTLYVSATSLPTSSIDVTSVSAATPVLSNSLAATLPLAFPVVFDQQQTY